MAVCVLRLGHSSVPMEAAEARTLDPQALGRRIAALRHAHGLSQRRLAEAAGVSHGYIALLELGRLPSPGKFRLDAVARALDLRTSDALTSPAAPPLESVPWGGETVAPSREARLMPLASRRLGRPTRAPVEAEAASAAARAQANQAPLGNVLGSVDHLRAAGARPLPVFRWGACGDPRDQESPPDPDRLEYPPPGRETLIGPNGFGVVVKGDSMAGRGIYDGDVVWVNPERPYAVGKVVLALVSDYGGDAGMVVKTFARTEVGDCLLSETATGRSPVVCREFKIIGPVVGITSWRLPR
jgi:SOS-response transcriptional repressor LexA